MKTRKICVTIGLVGILTTSFPSAPSAMSSDQPPATKEKNQLMSQEEMAHKMFLFKEAFPNKDIVHGEIGPTLHAVNVKTFRCPTVEELQHVVLKDSRGYGFGYEEEDFEINGITFIATGIPSANAKFKTVRVKFKGPEKKVTYIRCIYEAQGEYSPITVKLDKSPFKESLITVSKNDMKINLVQEEEEEIVFEKNIEFTVHPLIKK